jgi:hypothetical protein
VGTYPEEAVRPEEASLHSAAVAPWPPPIGGRSDPARFGQIHRVGVTLNGYTATILRHPAMTAFVESFAFVRAGTFVPGHSSPFAGTRILRVFAGYSVTLGDSCS